MLPADYSHLEKILCKRREKIKLKIWGPIVGRIVSKRNMSMGNRRGSITPLALLNALFE